MSTQPHHCLLLNCDMDMHGDCEGGNNGLLQITSFKVFGRIGYLQLPEDFLGNLF